MTDCDPAAPRRRWTASLRLRLFVSHLTVVVAAVVSMAVTTRLIGPAGFDQALRGSEDLSASVLAHQVDHAFSRSLQAALVVALAVAAVGATLISRALLRPLDGIRTATRRIAAGHYGEQMPLPPEPELARLAADVNQLAGRLADVERRRTQLVSEIAHEMRTPLTTLRGQLEGLADGVFPPTAELFASLDDELARLQRLAADMSNLSRVEEGAFDLRPARVDLVGLVDRTARRLRPRFADQRVRLEVEPALPAPVEVDPERITQVVINLLGNALDATPPGGAVRCRVRAEPAATVLSVVDTGVGIAADDLERIFGRFERVERPGRPAAGGCGIGLPIARGIARAHGGDVRAHSAGLGAGAVFDLWLPALSREGAS
jgi:signal transduction histidine kinase